MLKQSSFSLLRNLHDYIYTFLWRFKSKFVPITRVFKLECLATFHCLFFDRKIFWRNIDKTLLDKVPQDPFQYTSSNKSFLIRINTFWLIWLAVPKVLEQEHILLNDVWLHWYAKTCGTSFTSLTHFSPVPHFYTPWKRQKTKGFLTFSGVIEMWHWTKMG